jgi:4-amino-4-deoxy-L-arabinose transferase-like glycosyltransferase
MQKELKVYLILFLLIALNLFLNVYGNDWGLPSRWHSDEKVANVLHMLHERSIIDTRGYFFQPTGYHFILGAWLMPYLIFLKLTDFPFEAFKEAASVSWTYMARQFPDFATNIYVYSRTLSALLGAITVYMIFLLASKVYDRKIGIFSAAFLSVSMGFVGINHYAKYSSLVNFLIVLTLLFCIIALEKKVIGEAKRYFYISTFLAGMATSVKFNAAILLMPISLTFVFSFVHFDDRGKAVLFRNLLLIMFTSGALFILGFLVLTPSFLINFKDYFFMTKTLFAESSMRTMEHNNVITFLIGYINYFIGLLTIIGVPIFILILSGMIFRFSSRDRLSQKEIVVLSFIIAYWLIIIPISQNIYPQIKYIIAIVPFLIIFAGKAISDIFNFKKINFGLKIFLFFFIFIYSLIYTYSADLVFLKGDTRYASTKWIEENIPKRSRIEIFTQVHLICADSILDDYEIIFLGRSSKGLSSDNLPRWINIEGREQYIKQLNKNDSSADYIIINLNYMDKLYSGEYLEYLPGLADYVRSLFEGRWNFKLVKAFAPKNKEIVVRKMGNLIVPENILWHPIPDYEAVSPTIYIFERVKG